MNGVTFGDYHSYDDLELIRTGKNIGQAKVKKKLVDVEGAHGQLDYTEYFGEPKYDNRLLTFDFNLVDTPSMLLESYSTIQDALHGKKMRIVLDEEPDYYYLGRLEVSDLTNEKNIASITIECDCEPWKYKNTQTVVSRTISGSANLILRNSRKRVVPSITTTAAMAITFGGITTNVSAGTFTIPTLELVEGNNTVTVTGTGRITFTYQEGGL